jgi:hypothetical protein
LNQYRADQAARDATTARLRALRLARDANAEKQEKKPKRAAKKAGGAASGTARRRGGK